MPPKLRYSLLMSADRAQMLEKHLKDTGSKVSMSELMDRLVGEYLDSTINRPDQKAEHNVVDFLLRPGERKTADEGGLLWSNGGRWLLDWFLRAEPSWQSHHRTMFPRHWPLQPCRWETRCDDNGGDRRSVNDFIAEHRSPLYPNSICFPPDLPDITEDEWVTVVSSFHGCCGERLRPPTGPHWDAVCSLATH